MENKNSNIENQMSKIEQGSINEDGIPPEECIDEVEEFSILSDLATLVSTLVDKDTVKELTDKIIDYKKEESKDKIKIKELNIQIGEKNSSYFKMQYWQDILMVFLVLTCIGLLGYGKLLETSTIGTLMGSVIGYALGQFRERYRPKN